MKKEIHNPGRHPQMTSTGAEISTWYTYLKKESNTNITIKTTIKSQGKRTKEEVKRKTEL